MYDHLWYIKENLKRDKLQRHLISGVEHRLLIT